MKKTFILISCCALFMAACNGGEESGKTDSTDTYESADADSAAAAAVSSSSTQSEVDTNLTNIGTDRTAGGVSAKDVEKGEMLISMSDCLACHQVEKKLIGPAYLEVAQKYEYTEKNVNYLAGKIIQGGKGVWGEVPMTPHPDLSQEDAKAMAHYILSLKK